MHVNGAFHCTVRYRQLYNLFDQLRREFGPHCLPPFPPKKLLPLTPSQTEERRAQLEKFIQLGMYFGCITLWPNFFSCITICTDKFVCRNYYHNLFRRLDCFWLYWNATWQQILCFRKNKTRSYIKFLFQKMH